MARANQASKRKAGTKAVPVLGAAGLSLSLTGGASAAATGPLADLPTWKSAAQGHEILVVHGGGRIFTATLKRLGIESKFVAGLRVTDRETRDVAVMVFAGLLNKQLAAAISAAAVNPI